MRFHGMGDDDIYSIYGVAEHEGAIVVVRPDGYVGTVASLSKERDVEAYLRRCLVAAS